MPVEARDFGLPSRRGDAVTFGVQKAARDALERHQVAPLLAEASRLTAAIGLLEQRLAELEQQVSWWDRAVFFHDTADEKQIRELSRERDEATKTLAALRVRIDVTLSAAENEIPPLGIVRAIDHALELTRSTLQQTAGHRAKATLREQQAAVAALQTVGAKILALWVPGFDPDAATSMLADDVARSTIVRRRDPVLRDPRFGYAPISPEEVLARAAAALDAPGFLAARSIMAREAADLERAQSELALVQKSAKKQRGAPEAPVLLAEQRLSRERQEAIHASEAVAHAIESALGVFPPLAVYLALQTAQGMLVSQRIPLEDALHLDGTVRPVRSFTHRALVLAALVGVRKTLEAAFPGLQDLVSGRQARAPAGRAAAARAAPRSPFRVGALTDPGRPTEEDGVAQLMQRFEQAGVRQRVYRALGHGVLAGAVMRRRSAVEPRITKLDRLAFWSSSQAERDASALAARAEWHAQVLSSLAIDINTTVWQLGRSVHVLRVRDHVVRLSAALALIHTTSGGVAKDFVCPVINHQPALAEIAALENEMVTTWELPATFEQLASAVALRLEAGGPFFDRPSRPQKLAFADVVGLLAEGVRATEFRAAMARLGGSLEPAAHNALSPDRGIVWTLLKQAMSAYPPAALLYHLSQVSDAIRRISAVRRFHSDDQGNMYTCELYGCREATVALQAWARAALATLGEMPPDGLLVCHFVERDLDV